MDLELRHLRVVCAIADQGSLTKAAATLGLAQPALTAQLRRIEESLGGMLFDRGRHGARPTVLGELVLARARVVSAVRSLRDEAIRGNLSGTGASQYQPNGSYYHSSVSGTHRGCLDGPNGVDFDLYLQKWNGSGWSTVASSTGSGPDEQINYNGTAGYYRYRVYSYSGSGSYTMSITKP